MKEIVEDPSIFIALNKFKVISSVNKNVFLMLTSKNALMAPLTGQTFGETPPAKIN